MQKQKIDCVVYLVLQSTYDNIEIALYQKEQFLGKRVISKIYASKDLILNIDYLLKENNLDIEDLIFTVVNQGPGPFTTLRVVIVTANALNFSGKLPIVGIDGLISMLELYRDSKFPLTVALLNAYNNDVYFAIDYNSDITKGWQNIESFLNDLKNQFSGNKIRFIGNGVDLFRSEIIQKFDKDALFMDVNPKVSTIEHIAKMGHEDWEMQTNISEEINPIYLKDAVRFKKNEYA